MTPEEKERRKKKRWEDGESKYRLSLLLTILNRRILEAESENRMVDPKDLRESLELWRKWKGRKATGWNGAVREHQNIPSGPGVNDAKRGSD